jgi:PKD repeat protein
MLFRTVRALAVRGGAVMVLAAMLAVAAPSLAGAAPGDIGVEGPSYGDLGGSATGTKPESKLWFNDGIWWADMYDAATSRHRIHRLDRSAQTWSDAGTTLDTRRASRSDVLWDGSAGKLYVASHVTTTTGAAASSSQAGKLWRYSYSSVTKTYALDAGYPVDVNAAKSETLVLDKDSTGRLWATWVAGNRVYVNRTNGTDNAWGTPYVIPGSTAVDSDDISSLIAFGGRIGVMWSNQAGGRMEFAVHQDGAADSAWSLATVPTGWSPDDHINLKTNAAGEVFAATKTSESGSRPLALLLKRTAGGSWSSHVFGLGSDSHTRPIVVLDEPAGQVRMYATCPQPPATSGQSGGDICEKSTSMASPSFGSGIGTAIIRDQGTPKMNDATASKHNITAASGNVILAANATTDRYWHRDVGGSTPPPPGGPTAAFTATPTSGTAPLDVQFTDTSTGSPTSWSWSFGDGGTSTQRNPSHQFTAPGTYTVTLTVADANGNSDGETKSGLIAVGTTPPPPGGQQAFDAVADAHVKSTSATKNYGTETTLRVRAGTSPSDTTYRSYLKFDVAGLSGAPTGAKLRLFVTDATPDGGRVFPVASTWTETGITWANAPQPGATSVGNAGSTTAGAWVEIDLGASTVTGNGTYSFALVTTSSNSGYYASRQAADKPQLVVSTDDVEPPPPGALTANFTGSPTSGVGPLNVSFTDTSTGGPTGWTWDFGDGTTSTAQNPSHTYTAPGTYDVKLTVTGAGATPAEVTKQDFVTVTSEPPPPTGTRTLLPVADAHVKNTSANSNYGTLGTLQIRQGDASNTTTYRAYLKFDVTGLTGPVSGAKLRLFVTDASPDGGQVFRVGDGWTEPALTWNNAPVLPPAGIGSAGSVAAGTWVEINLGGAITGNGTYSFAIATTSSNSAIYTSREGANKPELVLPG